MLHTTSISSTNSERSTSSSLVNTPVTKRSKLSMRKKKGQSPGDQDKTSPFHSPVFLTTVCTPSQQARSPLSNSTIFSSLNSTPNRNWLSSQEPVRDILWDNTSPVNSRNLRGRPPVVLSNIQELCKGWSSDSHEEEGCASQKCALSDKWLSVKSEIAKSEAVGSHLQHPRIENIQVACKKDKQTLAAGRGGKPSKHLSSLLEIIQNPKVKGVLNFEETSSGDSTKEVIVQDSDPVNKAGDISIDWGDDDNSFLLTASQYVEDLTGSPTTRALTTIPSTLSSENVSSTSSSTPSGKSTALETNPSSSGSTEASEKKNMYTNIQNQLNDKSTNTYRSASSKSNTKPAPPSGSIPCSNFYDPSALVNPNAREYKSPLKNQSNFRVPNKHLSRRQNKTHQKPELSTVCENKVVRTLDERKLTVTSVQSQMGMPGVWMSQATFTNSNKKSSVNNDAEIVTLDGDSELFSSNGAQLTNCVSLRSKKNKPEKAFEMPKCAVSLSRSLVKSNDDDDDGEWGNFDDDIFSQENIQLLDSVIELEEKQFSQCLHNDKTEDLQLIRTQENSSQVNSFRKAPASQVSSVYSQSDVHTSKSNSEDISKTSSQQSDSYKKQYSRKEINRKKAEALRRRRQREEALSKTNNFVGSVYPS